MRKVNLIVLAAVAFSLLVVAWARGVYQTKESTAEQIKALHEEGRKAALKGDTSFLEKYLADDYIGIGGDGRVFTKTESIQRRKSGAVKIESIDELAVKVRMYEDTAIVNSLTSVRGMIDGKPIIGDSRATFVWVKQKGNWKEVAFQLTPVAPASK
jgi:ketosteroid isomerase-like protein